MYRSVTDQSRGIFCINHITILFLFSAYPIHCVLCRTIFFISYTDICYSHLIFNNHFLQVIFAVIDFVSDNLGPEFVESPPIQLPTLYKDTSNTIPLIFILSPGSDPMSSFLRFTKEMNYMDRSVIMELAGHTIVFLVCFKCHSFMPSLFHFFSLSASSMYGHSI